MKPFTKLIETCKFKQTHMPLNLKSILSGKLFNALNNESFFDDIVINTFLFSAFRNRYLMITVSHEIEIIKYVHKPAGKSPHDMTISTSLRHRPSK
ncbi:hypothetical protein [Desulfosediminicola flagellatus]|uniref:hypothetical protein n=1 Tax=Desulfosediminicola flagellatus TaxID=2569541 RepID=UPI0010AD6C19|nr:hypothetical protein [Desulfosediminicola flagellatus]